MKRRGRMRYLGTALLVLAWGLGSLGQGPTRAATAGAAPEAQAGPGSAASRLFAAPRRAAAREGFAATARLRGSPASGSVWTKLAAVTNGVSGGYFGFSTALSGNSAVVGATSSNGRAGAAYVFVPGGTGNAWSQQAELTASDGAPGDSLGWDVAIDGDTAVVTSPYHNAATGAAYVFVRRGGAWSQQAELTASDGGGGQYFGWSAAISGDTIIVGAYDARQYLGAAYVFVRRGGVWSQQAELTASDGAGGAQFGSSVALHDGLAVVAAPDQRYPAGAVYVFVRNAGVWSQQSEFVGGVGGQQLYGKVATDGAAFLAVGVNRNTGNNVVYVYALSGSGWRQQAVLAPSDGFSGDSFGAAVALDGDTAVVGATGNPSGRAYIFARSGSAWSQQAELSIPTNPAASYNEFGDAVAINGNIALVGAIFANTRQSIGAAFVYGAHS